ncbi:MAG: TonB-dependent receptor [Cyanobacteria bacterium P01_F01_bin.4]
MVSEYMSDGLRAFGAAAFILLTTISPAVAEDPLRIIVTAERKPEDIQDVPISITAITEQEIEDADITSLGDVARNVPNFSFFSGGDRSFNLFSIRGVSNASVIANRDPVDFFIDGIPYNFAAFVDVDLPDLERVEVLRGPQSILYGRNSLGGVVNLTTRKPTNTFEFNGAAGYGNFNDLDLRASVSGPIIDDELFFRLSGNFGSRDGFLRNTLLDDGVNEQSGGSGRGQLLWTPSDNLEVALTASFDDYRDGAGSFVILDSDPFETEQDVDGFSDLISNTQGLRISYTHPAFQFTSITSRRFSNNILETDGDFTAADAAVRVIDELSNTVFSQELRLQSPETAERFEWIFGGYYESNVFNSEGNGLRFGNDVATVFGPAFPLPPGSLSISDSETNTDTFAGFGQVSYRPVDALTLTAGLRYEVTNSTLEEFESVFSIPGLPDITTLSLSDVEQDGDELLPRFVAEYRFSPELTTYGSITRGYRPPGVNAGAGSIEAATFDAERSWNYEVGLKSSWLDDRLAVNLAVFHNPVDDFQILQFDLLGNSFTDNADISITGFELEARATPLPGFDIVAGFGLVDAEFTDFTNPFTGADAGGNNVLFAPDVTYNLALQYRSRRGFFGRLELQGLGTTFFEETNTLRQDPYAIVNARLGYEFDNTGIYLFGSNIFDQEFINQAFFLPPTAIASFGAPATYGVQVRTRF